MKKNRVAMNANHFLAIGLSMFCPVSVFLRIMS